LAGGFCDWVVFFSGDRASFFGVGRLSLGMDNRFFIEAKSFAFSVDTGMLELRLQERRKSYARGCLFGLEVCGLAN